jgi:hypothetical protein
MLPQLKYQTEFYTIYCQTLTVNFVCQLRVTSGGEFTFSETLHVERA